MDVLGYLKEIAKRQEEGDKHPLYMHNAIYHLCMEDKYLSVFTSMWIDAYKPFPFSIRDAQKDISGSIVVSIRDTDGQMIDFITQLVARTKARVAVKKTFDR